MSAFDKWWVGSQHFISSHDAALSAWNAALDAAARMTRSELGRCPHCEEVVNFDAIARAFDSLRAPSSSAPGEDAG